MTMGLPVSHAMDRFLGRLIERWTVERLLNEGYVDCYRRVHPRARGLTCATWQLSARVDYVFATRDLAANVLIADVVGGRTWAIPMQPSPRITTRWSRSSVSDPRPLTFES